MFSRKDLEEVVESFTTTPQRGIVLDPVTDTLSEELVIPNIFGNLLDAYVVRIGNNHVVVNYARLQRAPVQKVQDVIIGVLGEVAIIAGLDVTKIGFRFDIALRVLALGRTLGLWSVQAYGLTDYNSLLRGRGSIRTTDPKIEQVSAAS